MNQQVLNLHMVSDCSGETLTAVARASMSQFSNVMTKEYVWSLVSSKQDIDNIIKYFSTDSAVFVMYTIVDDDIREYLKHKCQKLQVPCVPVLSRIIRELSSYLCIKPNISKKHYEVFNNDYHARIDAMNYVLSHDDGQSIWEVDDADVILVGVSRTSKSPTSIYLAYRGYKVSNIPFVYGIELPIENFQGKFVVGLTIDPERLIEIRKNRIAGMGSGVNQQYTSVEAVTQEIEEAKKLFRRNNWPIINVTASSVEEISARVIQYYHRYKK